jgi:hypothetical protein
MGMAMTSLPWIEVASGDGRSALFAITSETVALRALCLSDAAARPMSSTRERRRLDRVREPGLDEARRQSKAVWGSAMN